MQRKSNLSFVACCIPKRSAVALNIFVNLMLFVGVTVFADYALAGHVAVDKDQSKKVQQGTSADGILVDKVCATLGSERPILYSDVKKRAEEFGETFEVALNTLIQERALMIAVKRLITYDAGAIKKAVNAHINKIIESNKLTPKRFSEILREHYKTSLSQYEYDTEYHLNKSQLEASIASTIEITPKMVEAELARRKKTPQDFSIAFISVASKSSGKGIPLTQQFARAKSIKEKISKIKNLDEIKKNFSGQSDISIGNLMDYEEGSLIPYYDQQLQKNPSSRVSEPFEDNGAVTMIVKFEKKLDEKTALENVRNALYKRAGEQGLNAITNKILAELPVFNNCK